MSIRGLATVDGIRGPFTRTVDSVPVLLINFDDNGDSVHDEAFACMRAYGFCSTFYFIGSSVAGKMSRLQPLYDFGWDIANHTQTGASLSGLTQPQMEAELTNCVTSLEGNGLVGAAYHVAYPGGYFDATVLAAMAATNMLTGRGCLLGTDMYFPISDLYELSVDLIFGSTVTLQQGKDWVDDVVAEQRIGIGLFHHLVAAPALPTEWGISDFHELMAYIAGVGIPVITITDLYEINGGGSVNVNMYRIPL